MPGEERRPKERVVLIPENFLVRLLFLAWIGGRDGLTGLHNRDGATELYQRMQKELERRKVLATARVGVVAVDVQEMKNFNECQGYGVGSAALARVARLLRKSVRNNEDIVARIGGDEFAVFANNGIVAAQKINGRFEANLASAEANFEAVKSNGKRGRFKVQAYSAPFEVAAWADPRVVVEFVGDVVGQKKRGEPVDAETLQSYARQRGLIGPDDDDRKS